MSVVVTGGAGFVGANLCAALAEAEEFGPVLALDDLSTGNAENFSGAKGVELVEGSVLDPVLMDDVLAEATSVVHLAARPSVPRSLEDPVATHRANTEGTLSVLEAIRHRPSGSRPHLVFSSSSSVYGANPALPKREDMVPMPVSPYAASKLAAEAYTFAYARSFSIEALVFRFFNVFGPRQSAGHAYAAVVPAFVFSALRDEPLTIYGDGTQTRDFTYVGSVVAVIVEALRKRVSDPGPVNLAFGSRVSVLELASLLEAVTGRALSKEHAPPRRGDVVHSQADQTRLRSLFPDVAPVDLGEGLRLTVEWARQS